MLAWHAGCMVFLTGCPFLAPARTPQVNTAPRITRPDPSDDLVLVMESDWNQVVAFARDDDGDVLNFTWVPPVGAVTETTDGEDNQLQYSVLSVRLDPALAGRRILLAVDDGQAEAFVEWTLQMPGALP